MTNILIDHGKRTFSLSVNIPTAALPSLFHGCNFTSLTATAKYVAAYSTKIEGILKKDIGLMLQKKFWLEHADLTQKVFVDAVAKMKELKRTGNLQSASKSGHQLQR
ncbi:uncharacterized protein PSFLO_02932 [Pseudozyma flocculosa]|uniref:Uncharacterized protein n=1 Tax=Pseudozyma flocculosa TaxID=84751 RepID=A0A5C3EZ14_9BASI|nr:uncharacterized protein PSFLO_02932 [Pseudozyma flocculosa]